MSVLELVERIAREELIALLGDVTPTPPAAAPVAPAPSEEELAARLAAEHHGQCWATFAAGVVDAGFAGRALDLYAFSAPWLKGDGVPAGAAELLRQIGDGYALLSQPVTVAPLPLPLQAFGEVVMRALAIDAWAAALGHPLELDVEQADYQLARHQDPGTDARDPGFDGAVGIAASRQELLEVLCDSATGRTVLQSDGFKRFAVERLAEARGWSFWVRTEEEGKAAQRLVLMAEAWFIAAHGAVRSSRDVSP